MENKHLSFEKAFNFGFRSFMDNLFNFFMIWVCAMALIGIALTVAVFVIAGGATFTALTGSTIGVGLAIVLAQVFAVLTILLCIMTYFFYSYQLIRFSNALYEGRTISWQDIFSWNNEQLFRFSFARILRAIKIGLGLLLLVIPGIYFALKYYFAGYSLLDGTNTTISEDTKFSAKLSHGVLFQLTLFMFLLWALNSLASILLFFPLPIIYLTSIHIYKQLKSSIDTENIIHQNGVIEANNPSKN